MKNKYSRGQKKYIRKEKARLRRELSNTKKQAEAIDKVFDKISNKLHVHPAQAPKADIVKKDKKSKIKKQEK